MFNKVIVEQTEAERQREEEEGDEEAKRISWSVRRRSSDLTLPSCYSQLAPQAQLTHKPTSELVNEPERETIYNFYNFHKFNKKVSHTPDSEKNPQLY